MTRYPWTTLAVIVCVIVMVLLLTACQGNGDICSRHRNEREVSIGGNCAHDGPNGSTVYHGAPCAIGC